MSNEKNEHTQPSAAQGDTAPVLVNSPVEKHVKTHRWPWIAGGILFVILLGVAGGFLGYKAAIQSRKQQLANQTALITTEQFQLGLQDMEAGRLRPAQQRFEYVIQIDPNFPDVQEKLSEVMLAMAMVSSPTPDFTPTVAPSPTPDNRGKEELWNAAAQLMRAKDWDNSILTLDALRTEDLAYHPIDVDGMYYIALRYRGINKIVMEGNLEGGIYDLALMEKFGPIDKEADAYRNWARFYLTGSSFWEVDWVRVLEYFSQIYASLPNLRDGTGYTAAERFRVASIKYGDKLAAGEDYCGARDQYRNAMGVAQDNALAPTATKVQLICEPLTPTPVTLTPTVASSATTPIVIVTTAVPPTPEFTTEAPTVEPVPSDTPVPEQSPTPGP